MSAESAFHVAFASAAVRAVGAACALLCVFTVCADVAVGGGMAYAVVSPPAALAAVVRRTLPLALLLAAAVLVRIRPLAVGHSSARDVVLGLGANALFCAASVLAHLAAHAPATSARWAWPEGRYGPPVLRPHVFAAASWALYAAAGASWRPVVVHRGRVCVATRRLQCTPAGRLASFAALVRRRLPAYVRRAEGALVLAVLLTAAETLVCRHPVAMRVFASCAAVFGAVRVSPPAPAELLLDVRLWTHVLVATAAALAVLAAVEACVEHWLGRPLGAFAPRSAGGRPDARLLVAALRSPSAPVRREAALELLSVARGDAAWRSALFARFVRLPGHDEASAEVSLGRALVSALAALIAADASAAGALSADLSAFGALVLASPVAPPVASPTAPPTVSPTAPPTVSPTTAPTTLPAGLSQASIFARDDPGRGFVARTDALPDVLRVSSAAVTGSAPGGHAPARISSGALRLAAVLLRPLADVAPWPTRVLATHVAEAVRSWTLPDDEAAAWVLDAAAALAVASYAEDRHGQVQYALDSLLLAAARLVEACDVLVRDAAPPFGVRPSHAPRQAPLFGERGAPTFARVGRMRAAAHGALDAVVARYGASLDDLGLSDATRAALGRLGMPVAP